jgi:hypothetical protein
MGQVVGVLSNGGTGRPYANAVPDAIQTTAIGSQTGPRRPRPTNAQSAAAPLSSHTSALRVGACRHGSPAPSQAGVRPSVPPAAHNRSAAPGTSAAPATEGGGADAQHLLARRAVDEAFGVQGAAAVLTAR